MKIPKLTPAHMYNAQAHADAVTDEEAQLAQHRALMKMAAGAPAPAPMTPPLAAPAPMVPAPAGAVPAPSPIPSVPRSPAMPKAARFAGIMGALRHKKIGL